MEKSHHWMEQANSWSCGYVALFWALTILKIGLDVWVSNYEA